MIANPSRLRMIGLAPVVVAAPIIAIGCGSSDSASTAADTTKAAATSCPGIAGAVATPLTVKNTTGYDVPLDAEDTCTVGDIGTPLFSGSANPALLDTTVPGDGTPLTVTFKGAPNSRGPVDLNWTVQDTSPRLPWSIRVNFGANDNAGAVTGWDEGNEKYGEGDDLDAITLPDGSRVVVGIVKSTMTKKQ
ncbi:MAG: hypothetical protein FJW92_06265 [Actinobacteria bacterium]|nr:hypothetical protein [Actinomycetota bacterium]